jgi:hypothetical protein
MFLLLMACQSPVEPASYLSVLSVSPPHGATNVATDTEVRAVFSDRIDEGQLSVDDVALLDAAGEELVAGLFYDDDTRMLRLVPADDLAVNTRITLVLGAGIPALGGGNLPAEVRSSFRTGGAGEADTDTDTDADTDTDSGN